LEGDALSKVISCNYNVRVEAIMNLKTAMPADGLWGFEGGWGEVILVWGNNWEMRDEKSPDGG
jgi:hypothetical protein